MNGGPEVALAGSGLRRRLMGWCRRFETPVELRPDRASVIEFRLTPGQIRTQGKGGLGIGPIRILPA